jgi:hypothetical protein
MRAVATIALLMAPFVVTGFVSQAAAQGNTQDTPDAKEMRSYELTADKLT